MHGNKGKKRNQKTIEKLRKITSDRWENPEYRQRMVEKHKGKRFSETTKTKMSLSQKGKKRKSHTAWNKGKKGFKHSQETKIKIKNGHLGKHNWWVKSGEKNPNWKGGITKIDRLCRRMKEYIQWRSDVFTRDSWTCKTCSKNGCYVTAHHIKGVNKIIRENNIKNIIEARNCKEMWNLNNGITLCEDCHKLTDNYRGKAIIKNKV